MIKLILLGPAHTRIFLQPRRSTVYSPNEIYYMG